MNRLTAFAIVSLVTSPLAGQSPEVRVAREVQRVGGVDAPQHLSFVRPPSLLLRPDGRLLVLDPVAPAVWILEADGLLHTRLGGEGEGPGEYTVPTAVGQLGDTTWVIDWPSPRVSFFDGRGDHLTTQPLALVDFGVPTSAPGGPTNLLGSGYLLAIPRSDPLGIRGRVEMPVLHGSRDGGSELRRVANLTMPQGLSVDGVGRFAYRPIPIPPQVVPSPYGKGFTLLNWDPNEPSRLEVTRFGPEATTLSEATIRVDPFPLDADARSTIIEAGVEIAASYIDGARSRGEVSGGTRDLVEAGLFLPSFFPPMSEAFVDMNERIWVKRWSRGGDGDWWVIGPEGTVDFAVRVPADVTLQTAAEGTVWGTQVGDFDIPYLVKYVFD